VDPKQILVIGTSIVKDVDPERLLGGYATTLVTKYHVSEALEFIKEDGSPQPSAVIIQQMSNDIKQEKEAQMCAEELVELVKCTREKYGEAKVIVSLPPGRGDRALHLKMQDANLLLKIILSSASITEVYICDNSNLLVNDAPSSLHFKEDMLHLNAAGASRLAENMRDVLRKCLKIQPKIQDDATVRRQNSSPRHYEKPRYQQGSVKQQNNYNQSQGNNSNNFRKRNNYHHNNNQGYANNNNQGYANNSDQYSRNYNQSYHGREGEPNWQSTLDGYSDNFY
jgi:lysophospholipase L1-like esterase